MAIRWLRTFSAFAVFVAAVLAPVGCGGGEADESTPAQGPTQNRGVSGNPDQGPRNQPEPTAEDLSAWAGFGDHREIKFCVDDSIETSGLMQYRPAEDSVGKQRGGYVGCVEKAVDEFKKANPDSDQLHQAVMNVEIPADGTWYPWVLTWWLDDCGNSIYVRILTADGEQVQKPTLVEDATTKTWHWKRAGSGLQMSKGRYKVGIINREDGARVRCVLFTTRPYENYTPVNPES